MAFFGNKRKDFSIQPPRQQVDGTPFFVTDSANIDFTLENLNLTANLTQLLSTSGTYGDSTNIPVLQIDQFGRITGVEVVAISPAGIALENNGNPNDSQTILNLVDSATIGIVDLGGGDIEFNYIGTSSTYTVDNGLEAESGNPNNFQLGGALTKTTEITVPTGFRLKVTSTSETPLFVKTTGNTGQFGINCQSENGAAGFFYSKSATGITTATEGGSYSAAFKTSTQTMNNAVLHIVDILAYTIAYPTLNGFGASIDFRLATADFVNFKSSNKLISKWSTADDATRTSQFEITGVNNAGADTTIFTLKGTGQLQLNNYTAGFSGTAVYALGVDASGNVITTTGGGGGSGTVTSITAGTGLEATASNPILVSGTIQLNSKLAPADSIAGNAGKFLRVNAGATAVEYATVTSGDSISPFLLMGG